MNTIKTLFILIAAATLFSCNRQSNKQISQTENNMIEKIEETAIEKLMDSSPHGNYYKMVQLAKADYGTRFTIGRHQLCPEQKLILTEQMFGTAVIDAIGFFPDTTLQYDRETMIIFAGCAFFDKSDYNIDWQTVELLSYRDHYSEFTDGKTLYNISYGKVHTYGVKYEKNTYKPNMEEKPAKRHSGSVKELTEGFYVKRNKFYFGDFSRNGNKESGDLTPILEPFDVPNLRTIVSKSGFETDYITDGKQVLYGGGKTGVTLYKRFIREYAVAKRWMIEGVDFATLRVLGKNIMADKNALYYGTEVIPFDKLEGFKFIIREL